MALVIPRVLGLDLAVSKTGIVDPDGRCRTIRARGTAYGRIDNLANLIYNVVTDSETELVVLEDYALFGRFPRGMITTVEAGGHVKATLDGSVPIVTVAPARLKLFATGNGKASKAAMLNAAQSIAKASPHTLDTVPANDDEADAFFLRRMGRAAYTMEERSPLLADIAWPVVFT